MDHNSSDFINRLSCALSYSSRGYGKFLEILRSGKLLEKIGLSVPSPPSLFMLPVNIYGLHHGPEPIEPCD